MRLLWRQSTFKEKIIKWIGLIIAIIVVFVQAFGVAK